MKRETITLDEAKKRLKEVMDTLNSMPADDTDPIQLKLWGEVWWLNEVIAMADRKIGRNEF